MKRKSFKRVTAIVLSICCILTAIPILAIAQTYDEWKNEVRWNGDFEAGYEGMDVYGWKMVPFDNSLKENTDYAYAVNNHTFKTAIEEDNKVAQLNRNGGGYVAMASQPISVIGEQEYEISVDYKTIEVTAAAETNPTFQGINLVVEQLNAEGEQMNWTADGDSSGHGTSVSDAWSTITQKVIMAPDTTSIVVYIAIRGQWNARAKVLIDNVDVLECDENNVLNGDFEMISDTGVAHWSLKSCAIDGNPVDTNSYNNYYVISTIQDSDNAYMKLAPKTTTMGYAQVRSSYIRVSANQKYDVSFDFKTFNNEDTTNTRPSKLVVCYYGSDRSYLDWDLLDNDLGRDLTTWTSLTYQGTAPADATYMTVNLYIGGVWGKGQQEHYFDNVSVSLKTMWTEESTNYEGTAAVTTDYSGSYDIVTESINGREDVLKLYVSRSGGSFGAVTYFSEKIPVTGNTAYTTSYDLKITGRDDDSTTSDMDESTLQPGAVYVIRYLDANNNIISYERINTANSSPISNQDWTTYSKTMTTPESATYAQIGLLIGSTKMNTLKDMAYYYDNIALEKTEVYEKGVNFPLFEGGDIDAVEGVDVRDLVHYKGLQAGEIEESFNDHADMNKNSKYDNDDQTLLMWKLIGKY